MPLTINIYLILHNNSENRYCYLTIAMRFIRLIVGGYIPPCLNLAQITTVSMFKQNIESSWISDIF